MELRKVLYYYAYGNIANTTPLNYLLSIGKQELLPALFGQIIIPEAVFRELQATTAPQVVRQWMSNALNGARLEMRPC